jgi:hypothetical protein
MPRLVFCLAVMAVAAAPAGRRQLPQQDSFLALSSYASGASAAHRLSFLVTAGDPEIYSATVSYGEGFRLAGFRTQGPAGSPIGTYELDFDFDGAADRVMPIHSVSNDLAYIDVIADGRFAPDLEPSLHGDADATLRLRMPFGGDANSATYVSPFGARIALSLQAGIIVNPPLGGAYPVLARMTTVDPDTDGPDDGFGGAPETTRVAATVTIEGPMLVPFHRLTIDEFDLRDRRPRHDRFDARGRFVVGAGSDGVDLQHDSVTITFSSFSQTIPASAFKRTGHSRVYHGHGPGPGVHRFELRSDGRFEVDVRRLTLINVGPRPLFELSVGNDFGSATVKPRHKKWDDD